MNETIWWCEEHESFRARHLQSPPAPGFQDRCEAKESFDYMESWTEKMGKPCRIICIGHLIKTGPNTPSS